MSKQQKWVFRPKEQQHHVMLIKNHFFGNDCGNGRFGKYQKQYSFVLQNGVNNLYEPIRAEALKYFKDNKITWWGDNT